MGDPVPGIEGATWIGLAYLPVIDNSGNLIIYAAFDDGSGVQVAYFYGGPNGTQRFQSPQATVIAESVTKCDRLDAAVLAELAQANLKPLTV